MKKYGDNSINADIDTAWLKLTEYFQVLAATVFL